MPTIKPRPKEKMVTFTVTIAEPLHHTMADYCTMLGGESRSYVVAGALAYMFDRDAKDIAKWRETHPDLARMPALKPRRIARETEGFRAEKAVVG